MQATLRFGGRMANMVKFKYYKAVILNWLFFVNDYGKVTQNVQGEEYEF